MDAVTELGDKLSIEEQQRAVHDNIHMQITNIGEALDQVLLVESPRKAPAPEAAKSRPSGLSFAVGSQAPKVEDVETLGKSCIRDHFLLIYSNSI